MKYLLILMTLIFTACEPGYGGSSTSIEADAQEKLSKAATMQVGMPSIVNFQEKRLLKQVLELRDDAKLRTYTYIVDMNGSLHKICDSIGYGIPYATQYTNPQVDAFYTERRENAHIAIPQADPNGLYSPAAADGTWVLCLDPKSQKLMPLYIEPHIITSPFALN
jgi:hypothetical protein